MANRKEVSMPAGADNDDDLEDNRVEIITEGLIQQFEGQPSPTDEDIKEMLENIVKVVPYKDGKTQKHQQTSAHEKVNDDSSAARCIGVTAGTQHASEDDPQQHHLPDIVNEERIDRANKEDDIEQRLRQRSKQFYESLMDVKHTKEEMKKQVWRILNSILEENKTMQHRHSSSSQVEKGQLLNADISSQLQQAGDTTEDYTKYNGLSPKKINFPGPILSQLPYKLDVDLDAARITETSFTRPQCKNLRNSGWQFTSQLLKDGFVKIKVKDANKGARGKDWQQKYRNLKNTPASKNDNIFLPEENDNHGKQKIIANQSITPPTSPLPVEKVSNANSRKGQRMRAAKRQANISIHRGSSGATVASSDPMQMTGRLSPFIELNEIRNLGRGVFHVHRIYRDDAIKRLPELNGITLGQVMDFMEETFSITNNDSLEGRKENAEKLLRILHTLKPDPTMANEGLLIPVIVDWNFMQINGDQDVAGLGVDGANSWITKFFKTLIPMQDDQDEETGRMSGINTPPPLSIQEVIESTKRTHGFMGTPIPIQMGKFNGLNMLDHLVIGSPKLNFIVPANHCHHIREEVSNYLEKLLPNVVTNNQLQAPFKDAVIKPCVMQHECIFVTPLFLGPEQTTPIRYKAVMQEAGEMLILGAGTHFESLCLGPNVSRLNCFLFGDYYEKTTELTIQCDKEATLHRTLIWSLEDESKEICKKGIADNNRKPKKQPGTSKSKDTVSCVPSTSSSVSVLANRNPSTMTSSPPSLQLPSSSQEVEGIQPTIKDSGSQPKRKRRRKEN